MLYIFAVSGSINHTLSGLVSLYIRKIISCIQHTPISTMGLMFSFVKTSTPIILFKMAMFFDFVDWSHLDPCARLMPISLTLNTRSGSAGVLQ